jgi:ABC-type dipeptide/oligopeptide/nickel transport system permease component
MFALVVRRLLFSIPVLLLLTLVLFLAVKLVPGDAALVMAGERATPEKVEYIRQALNLDQPWYTQYGMYLWRLVTQFDLGHSLFHDRPILDLLAFAVPATVELGAAALFVAIPVGICLGILSAVFRNTWIDKVSTTTALAGVSMPIFWLALILMYVFSVQLGWLPTSGRMSDEIVFDPALDSITRMYTIDGILIGLRTGEWEVFRYALRHLMLPAVALSTIPMAQVSRMTRSSFLEVLGQDFIRTARAKGVRPTVVVLKHAFRNASLQIVTVSMLQAGTIFGGAVITETMFAWPGLGKVLVESISSRDFPMVQSGTLFVGCVFVMFNLTADVLYGMLDPRVKKGT